MGDPGLYSRAVSYLKQWKAKEVGDQGRPFEKPTSLGTHGQACGVRNAYQDEWGSRLRYSQVTQKGAECGHRKKPEHNHAGNGPTGKSI